jgi:hypothetical protein
VPEGVAQDCILLYRICNLQMVDGLRYRVLNGKLRRRKRIRVRLIVCGRIVCRLKFTLQPKSALRALRCMVAEWLAER